MDVKTPPTTTPPPTTTTRSAAITTPPLPFDVRLIPKYDGMTNVVEWVTRAEMLCDLRGAALDVLPLHLTGGAFAVWSQLPVSSCTSLDDMHDALYAALALDQHAAYEAFTACCLWTSESADVHLANLQRLSALFGGISEHALACAFIARLPDDVPRTIHAGARAESVLARARAVLSEDQVCCWNFNAQRTATARNVAALSLLDLWPAGTLCPGLSKAGYVEGDASAPASSPSNQ